MGGDYLAAEIEPTLATVKDFVVGTGYDSVGGGEDAVGVQHELDLPRPMLFAGSQLND